MNPIPPRNNFHCVKYTQFMLPALIPIFPFGVSDLHPILRCIRHNLMASSPSCGIIQLPWGNSSSRDNPILPKGFYLCRKE